MRRVRDVILLEEAAGDLGEGMAFYEAQQQGIGCYFFDSILADIDSLLLYAGVHSERLGYYRMLASRFPFAIYYEIVDDIARVVAVLDMRRDPAWLRREMEERHG